VGVVAEAPKCGWGARKRLRPELAVEQREPILPFMHVAPRWRALYGQPRFDAVFQAVFPGFEVPKAEV
jgi:hypothetical protein